MKIKLYLLGTALFLAGCINLSGANLSNIGNGNSVSDVGNGNSFSDIGNGNSVSDVGNGNNISDIGNGNYGGPGGPGGPGGYTVDGVRFNHDGFVVRRMNNFNPSDYRYDAGAKRLEYNNYNYYQPSPSPSPYTPIMNPDQCLVAGYALSGGNQVYEINKDQGDWEWTLPQGVELVSLNTTNGPQVLMLWAHQDAATGSVPLTLTYRSNRNIQVTATVEILDQGSVQVVL